jgi:hypothetical protein
VEQDDDRNWIVPKIVAGESMLAAVSARTAIAAHVVPVSAKTTWLASFHGLAGAGPDV